VTLDGAKAAKKLTAAILSKIESLSDFEPCFIALVKQKIEAAGSDQAMRLRGLGRRKEEIVRRIDLVTAAIAEMGGNRPLFEKLQSLEAQQHALEDEASELKLQQPRDVALPSIDTIKQSARELFTQLATTSPEVGRLLQKLIPDLRVYPYRLCDSGKVVLRAQFTLHLAALAPASSALEHLDGALRLEMSVDLFDPPQRVTFRDQVMDMRARKLTERHVATALGITQPAVQYAAALDRVMKKRDITDPYLPITEPPSDCGRFRRFRHDRYRFQPLNGYTG
jgi:hypothetical protein